ncbi:four helix bundle protein [Oleidesulfovibrio sp.]|uniref:four helix bundle protein n=1 Tax=Oleidesulfovibrio sp. TaxID=2909707 RepID=UPI003A89A66D
MSLKDFTLLAKLEALDIETHKIVKRFEKSERHVLSAEIRHTVATLLHLVIKATKTQLEEKRKKRPPVTTREILWQTDVELEYLRVQVRKSFALRLINEGCYEVWSRQIAEVGQMLGAWIKRNGEDLERFQGQSQAKRAQQGSLI